MSENGRATVTWDEFMAEEAPCVPSLVGDGLLVKAGGYTLIGGDTGVGKTILVANLLLFLADAREEWLGFPLPGRVVPSLILEAEGNRYKFRDWIAHIARNLGIRKSPAISFHQRGADLSIEGHNLEAMIAEAKAEIAFLDTIGRFWSGKENDATEWRAGVTIPLAKLGDAFDVAFLFGDHYNKSLERTGTGKVRGTPAKIQDCGAAMRLEIGKGGQSSRVLHIDRVRDGALPEPDVRALTIDLRQGTIARDDTPGVLDSLATPSVRISNVVDIVREIATNQGGYASTAQLVIRLKNEFRFGKSQAENLIKSAVEARKIERCGQGKYQLPGELLP